MCDMNLCMQCQCENCESQKNELPDISSAFLILTEKCNLKCKYCFVQQNAKEMTYSTAKDAIDYLAQNAKKTSEVPSITFFGGEPMLKYDEIIKPIIQYVKETYGDNYSLGITTNGTLLTKDIIDFFTENNIGILFSVDGDQTTQNLNRPFHNGKGSFEHLNQIIPYYLEHYPAATFRATIDFDTAKYMMENIYYALKMGYDNMFFIPNAFANWTKEEEEILKEQVELFTAFYIENARQDKLIHLNPLDEKIREILDINRAIIDKKEKPKNKCGLGLNKYGAIGTQGEIFACQEMSSNSAEDDFFLIGSIYKGIDHEKRMKLSNAFDLKLLKGRNCETCKLYPICNGACVANNYLVNKDIHHMAPIICYWYQLLLESAIEICNVLGNEENKTFKNYYFSSEGRG